MTNIGMIGKRSKKGDMEFITAIADSQGTDRANEVKGETHLKIFTAGSKRNILLLGTGSGDIIHQTEEALRDKNGIDTVEEAAEAVLELTHECYSKMTKGRPEVLPRNGFGVDFFIGGPGKDDLVMARIDTTGFRGNRKRDKYENRGVFPVKVHSGNWNGVFDGSALRHVNSYVDGQSESGRPIIVEDVAGAFVEMHDLSLRGAKDIGVNEKWNYGLITPEKTVRLIHPGVHFRRVKDYLEYVGTFMSPETVSVLQGLDEEDDARKSSAASDLASDVGIFRGAFYYALVSELEGYSNLKKEFTRLAEVQLGRPDFRERFDEIGRRRLELLAHVRTGIDVLLSGDARAMMKYASDANERRKTTLNRLLETYCPKID